MDEDFEHFKGGLRKRETLICEKRQICPNYQSIKHVSYKISSKLDNKWRFWNKKRAGGAQYPIISESWDYFLETKDF